MGKIRGRCEDNIAVLWEANVKDDIGSGAHPRLAGGELAELESGMDLCQTT